KARNGPPFRAFFCPGFPRCRRQACMPHNPCMDSDASMPPRPALHAHVERGLARLPEGLAERGGEPLRRVLAASDFALDVFVRQPEVLQALLDDPSAAVQAPRLDPGT